MGRRHGTSGAVKSWVRVAGIALAATHFVFLSPSAAQPPSTPPPTTPTPGTPRAPGTPTTPGTPTPPTDSTTGVPEGPTPSGTVPNVQIPGVLLPPRGPLDFLYAPPAQGPLTVTPSLTITEEFNDNVFLTHSNKQSDFITQFTPAVVLQAQQRGFQLLSSFNFTAEIYAKNPELDSAANRLAFLTSVLYQAKPGVTLTLTENLAYNKNSNLVATSGVSSGREASLSNVFAPAVSVQLTPRTTWRVSGAYVLERFGSGGTSSQNSNVYRVGTGFDHTLTPRLTLTAAYDFAYLDVEQQPASFNHTLLLGGSYQLTPTLTVSATAGPSLLLTDRGDTEITPAAHVRVVKTFSWGSMSAFYDQSIGTSGGFGGVTDNKIFGGNISVLTLLRGLILDLSPRYSMNRTTGASATTSASQSNSDINALNVVLSARYQIARYVSLVANYYLLHQTGPGNGHNGGTTTTTNINDIDQNRVNFGVQFGYPINFY
jgi:hypothetical protein